MLLAKTSNHRLLAPVLRKPDLMVPEELNPTRLRSLCATVRGVHTHLTVSCQDRPHPGHRESTHTYTLTHYKLLVGGLQIKKHLLNESYVCASMLVLSLYTPGKLKLEASINTHSLSMSADPVCEPVSIKWAVTPL